MKIEHRLGRLHANADGLSRRPWPEDTLVDKLEETDVSFAPLIVETTTHVDESTSPEGMQSEPRQTPLPWSNEHFRTEQSKDKHLHAVRQWLEAGRRQPKQEIEGANRHMWSLWSQYNRLLLKDELLYRRWFDEKTGCENLQLCVPQHLKGDLLQELHDQCGHLSVCKTTDYGNCFTGLAILWILNCTVKHVAHVVPEMDQLFDRGHPCNPLGLAIC